MDTTRWSRAAASIGPAQTVRRPSRGTQPATPADLPARLEGANHDREADEDDQHRADGDVDPENAPEP